MQGKFLRALTEGQSIKGWVIMSRVEDEVCKKIAQRAEVGKSKYGVTMETAPLSRLEWLIHAQEEAMDLAVYLQKLIEMEMKE